jgi:hypothetical protein
MKEKDEWKEQNCNLLLTSKGRTHLDMGFVANQSPSSITWTWWLEKSIDKESDRTKGWNWFGTKSTNRIPFDQPTR